MYHVAMRASVIPKPDINVNGAIKNRGGDRRRMRTPICCLLWRSSFAIFGVSRRRMGAAEIKPLEARAILAYHG